MDETAGTSNAGVLDRTSYSLNQTHQFEESQVYDANFLQMLDEPFDLVGDGMQLRTDKYAGFDNNTGETWIYPTNYPMRQYQYAITKAALFKNTLVVLPTGLGKTFIAAVVMYNIYRWYPTGKVIFMAPTRPLVNQQIEACYKIMGIPKEDTAEMTGKQKRKNRPALWNSKRVFFVTPQVVQADLNAAEQQFPLNKVKLLVVDEAHKAKGRYAYTEVVQAIASRNKHFRVLALSATPGRGIDDVAEVIKNLLISHIEVRWENSIDVSPYTHKKNIKSVVIPLGARLTRVRDNYIEIIDPYVRNLLNNNVISGHTGSLSRGWLIMEQKRFRENSLLKRHPKHSEISSDFSTCISMYHALELLVRHGLRVFLNFFDDDTNSAEEKYFVAKDAKMKAFLDKLREEVGPNPFLINANNLASGAVPEIPKNLDFGHPKFIILQKQLKEHFEANENSKVIVFCEYRDSVALVHRLLLQNRPLIRPKCIVGQGGTSGIKAVSQKEQIAAMKDFRTGVSNALIATCVAEEGIDVGEVDLIVCFDITKNPTRFVQRIGRTGRQRKGKVIMLVTEGKEHDMLKEVLASKDKTNQKIAKSNEILGVLYRQSPRLVPTEFDPKCVETFIKIEEEVEEVPKNRGKKRKAAEIDGENVEENENKINTRSRAKKAKSIAPRGTQDVRNFFKKSTTDLNADEREIFACPPPQEVPPFEEISFHEPMNTSKVIDKSVRLGKTDLEVEIELILQPILGHKVKSKPEFLKVPPLQNILKNSLCSKTLKKYFLQSNGKYLKDKLEKHDILAALNGNDGDLEVIDDEMEEIDGIFDGRENVLAAISDETVKVHSNKNEIGVELGKHLEVNEEFMKKFKENYEKFYHSKRKSGEPTEVKEKSVEVEDGKAENADIFSYDSLPHIEQNESKYRNNICKTIETPLKKVFNDSPLMKAFNKSIQKRHNSDYASPITSKSKHINDKMIFEYFGLKDLDDLFAEEEEVSRNIFESSSVVVDTPQKSVANRFLRRLNAFEYENVEKSVGKSPPKQKKELVLDDILFESDSDLSDRTIVEEISLPKVMDDEVVEASGNFLNKLTAYEFVKSPVKKREEDEIAFESESESIPGEKRNINLNDVIFECDSRSNDAKFEYDGELEVKEAAFIAGYFGKTASNEDPDDDKSKNLVIDYDLSTIDDSQPVRNVYKLPPEKVVINSSSTTRKELNLDIESCINDLINEEEEEAAADKESKFDLGNLDDIFGGSDDDMFAASPAPVVEDDLTQDYDYEATLREIVEEKENVLLKKHSSDLFESTIVENMVQKVSSDLFETSVNIVSPKREPKDLVPESSPSILKKKMNFSRLKMQNLKPGPLRLTQSDENRSPYFKTCTSNVTQHDLSQFQNNNDTVIPVNLANNKRVIKSSEEEDEEEEIFATCPENLRRSSRFSSNSNKRRRSPLANKFKKPKRRKNHPFLDMEAAVDGTESEDEDDFEGLSDLIDDSIIDHHGEDVENHVDMQVKYLQSIRSPVRAKGAFKIPDRRKYMNMLDIFSQPVYHEGVSVYEDESFVVNEDEVEESPEEMCELERAEAILKAKRRRKKQKKRSKIIPLDDESPDEEEYRQRILSLPD